MRSYNRVPWTHSVKHPRHQTGTQTRMEERRQRRPNGRITETECRNTSVYQGQLDAFLPQL